MDKELFEFYKAALSEEVSNPLCDEYKTAWRKCGNNKEMLLSLALSQQASPFVATYAYQGKGLTKGYLLREFGDYINGKLLNDCDGVEGYTYGLYVDVFQNIMLNADVSHFMFCDGASICVPKTKCPTIYISNKSKIRLVGDGFNSVKVYLFDESSIIVEDLDEGSDVVIYKYSDKCKVKEGKFCFGNVKQFQKELRL